MYQACADACNDTDTLLVLTNASSDWAAGEDGSSDNKSPVIILSANVGEAFMRRVTRSTASKQRSKPASEAGLRGAAGAAGDEAEEDDEGEGLRRLCVEGVLRLPGGVMVEAKVGPDDVGENKDGLTGV